MHCLTGHDDNVCSIISQATDPQARPHSRALPSPSRVSRDADTDRLEVHGRAHRPIGAKPCEPAAPENPTYTLHAAAPPQMQAGVRAGDHRLARQDHPAVGHPQAGHHGHADVPQEERARARHAPQRVRPPDAEPVHSCPALSGLKDMRGRPRAQRCHQSARQRGLEAAQALCGGSACELVLDKAKSTHVHCMFCYLKSSR